MWFLPTVGLRSLAPTVMDCNPTIALDPHCHGVVKPANRFFEQHPHEENYGFICDDMVPRTPDWWKHLEQAAGTKAIAICNDGAVPDFFSNPLRTGSCWVVGGDLVRAAGWLLPPWCVQRGVDTVWNRLARKYDLFRYLPDVVVELLYYPGKRERDETDEISNRPTHKDPNKMKWVENKRIPIPKAWEYELAFHQRVEKVL